jgi:hypothetical protein
MHTPFLKREAICYGFGIGTAYLSLRGATRTGTGTLYDHLFGSGKGNHANGGRAYSSALSSAKLSMAQMRCLKTVRLLT